MADPFIGEIRMFAGNFAPRDWAFCDGQLQSISQNTALFSLLGTTYGGDGVTTFALPDMRGRVPIHQGQGPGLSPQVIGQVQGTETVTLTAAQMPAHGHLEVASTSPASTSAGPGGVPATPATVAIYGTTPPNADLAAAAVVPVGGNQPHSNMAPYGTLSFIICLFGIFPSRN